MVAANPNHRVSSARPEPRPPLKYLAERVRHHFEISWEEFLRVAVQKEIHFREQREAKNRARLPYLQGQGTSRWSTARPRLSAEDIRIHAQLSERLALLNYERHGLWPKLRRFLFGNHMLRWLGLQPQRTGHGRTGRTS
jgi:hypothetical protein